MILITGVIFVLCIMVYKRYSPNIDIVESRDKHIILLWYDKYYDNDSFRRVYKKLFEI